MKQYKLKKDITSPEWVVKTGTIYKLSEDSHYWTECGHCLDIKYVEHNFEWFEEYHQPIYTLKDIIDFAIYYKSKSSIKADPMLSKIMEWNSVEEYLKTWDETKFKIKI